MHSTFLFDPICTRNSNLHPLSQIPRGENCQMPHLVSCSKQQLHYCTAWCHAHIWSLGTCVHVLSNTFLVRLSRAPAWGTNKFSFPHSATSDRFPYWNYFNWLNGTQLNQKTEIRENHIKQQILVLRSDFGGWGGVYFLIVCGRALPFADYLNYCFN